MAVKGYHYHITGQSALLHGSTEVKHIANLGFDEGASVMVVALDDQGQVLFQASYDPKDPKQETPLYYVGADILAAVNSRPTSDSSSPVR